MIDMDIEDALFSLAAVKLSALETQATWDSFYDAAKELLEASVSGKNLTLREISGLDPRLRPAEALLDPSFCKVQALDPGLQPPPEAIKKIKHLEVYPHCFRPEASHKEHVGRWLSFAAIYCPWRVEWLLRCAKACKIVVDWDDLPPVPMDLHLWKEHVKKVGWAPGKFKYCYHPISEELDYPPLYVNVVIWSIITFNEKLMDLLSDHGLPEHVQRKFVNAALFRTCFAGCLTSMRAMHVIWGDFIDKKFTGKTQGDAGDLIPRGEDLTSLLCCGMYDNWRCCEWLIREEQWPADQLTQPSGDNLMHILVEKSRGKEDSHAMNGIQRLVRAGVSVNHKNFDAGHTPLMVAVWHQRWMFAKELIRVGADPTVVDKDGDSITHCVSIIHRSGVLSPAEIDRLDLDLIAEVVRLVCANGVDINAKNRSGLSALDLVMGINPSAKCKSASFAAALKHRMMCEFIVLGADLSRSRMSKKGQKKIQCALQDARRRGGKQSCTDPTTALVTALRTPVAEIMGGPCRCFWCRPSPATSQGDRKTAAVGRRSAPARDRGICEPNLDAGEEEMLADMFAHMNRPFDPESLRRAVGSDAATAARSAPAQTRVHSLAGTATAIRGTVRAEQKDLAISGTPDTAISSLPSPASAGYSDSIGTSAIPVESVEDDTVMECVACQESRADFVMEDCGHRCYCRLCLRQVVHRTLQSAQDKRVDRKLKPKVIVRTKVACPLCRTEGMAVRETCYDGHIYE